MNEVASIRYRIRKADHDKAVKVSRDYLDYEHAHPELFHYTSTRFYYMDAPDNPDEEIWMFIDEFDDYDDYLASLVAARANDPETQKYATAFKSVVIPGSTSDRERWTEAEELRVDF